MKRGDIYAIAGRGDFSNKPRPALVVQSDLFNPHHPSATVCPISSTGTDDRLYRVLIGKGAETGLNSDSEIEVDKLQAVWTSRFGQRIGEAPDDVMAAVDTALRLWLDL